MLNPLLSLSLRFDFFQISHLMRVVAMTTAADGLKFVYENIITYIKIIKLYFPLLRKILTNA